MNNVKKSALSVKVLAINTMNEYAAKFVEYEMKHFFQFIGQSIFKVDGSVKAKFAHEKLSFKGQLDDGTFFDAHYWFETRRSFDLVTKICINGGSYDVQPTTAFCQYEETRTELFALNDSGELMESTRQKEDYSIRYNEADIQALANAAKQAAAAYESAERAVPYLFRRIVGVQRLTNS